MRRSSRGNEFCVAFPSTYDDCAATLRLQCARVWSGADPPPAVRIIQSVRATARVLGDVRLAALAEEIQSKVERFASALRRERSDERQLDGLRHVIALLEAAGDVHGALATRIRLAMALLPLNRVKAMQMLEGVDTAAGGRGDAPLMLATKLSLVSAAADPDDTDIEDLVRLCDEADAPVYRARALRQKTFRGLLRGVWQSEAAEAARETFRAESAASDLVAFCSEIAQRTFGRGAFEVMADAAGESVAVTTVMPFPYGEAPARLMLAMALSYLGEKGEARAELARLWSLPDVYRGSRRLDLLPGLGLLIDVNQPERAAELAREYVRDLETAGPSRELSLALHYLANACVVMRRWPEVFAALEQNAAVDDACGDEAGAIGKRVELAHWRFTERWLQKKTIPHDVAEAAEEAYANAELQLQRFTSEEAETLRLTIRQMRSALLKALGRSEPIADARLQNRRNDPKRLGWGLHETNAGSHAGLLLHDRGRFGDHAAAVAAQEYFDAALTSHRRRGAPDAIANAAYLAASNERVLAHQATTKPEASRHLVRVVELLEEAEQAVAALLVRYDEPETEASDRSRMALHAPWKKIYDFAIGVFADDLHDYASAFAWSERWKGRALAMTLGALDPGVPEGLAAGLVAAEREAVAELRAATTYPDVANARRRVAAEREQLAALPEAAEYLALRTGAAITFAELAVFLRTHAQSPTSTNGAQ